MTISKINSNSLNGDESTLSFSTSGTERMRIDSSGNVGIGTNLPQKKLHIESASPALRISSTVDGGWSTGDVIGEFGFWAIDGGGREAGYIKSIQETNGGSVTDGALVFGTTTYGNTTSTERMRIDSSGRVTTPSQPKFFAFANIGGNDSVPGNTVPSTWSILNNTGNSFSNGVFTAPVAGTYRFFYSVLTGSTGKYGLLQFRKNGSPSIGVAGLSQNWSQTYTYASSNDKHNSKELIIDLAQNDTIDIITHGSYNSFYWTGGYSYFGGHLLG